MQYRVTAFFAVALLLVSPWAQGEKSVDLDKDPHLAGWWSFDDKTGETAVDGSGKGRNGTLKDGATFDSDSAGGAVGKALAFDGKAYVEVIGYKGVTGNHSRTVAAWIKTTSRKGSILQWGQYEGAKWWLFGFCRTSVGVVPRGGYLFMETEVDDGDWHHVAAVVGEAELPNLQDDVTLYLDGEIAEIHPIGLLDLWPIDTGSGMDVCIGRDFKGLLDDVRVYDRALSDEEIEMLADMGNP